MGLSECEHLVVFKVWRCIRGHDQPAYRFACPACDVLFDELPEGKKAIRLPKPSSVRSEHNPTFDVSGEA